MLNQPIFKISEKLAFLTTADRELTDRALLVQPGIGGSQIIVENDGTMDTDVNLESLFELVTTRPDVIESLFNSQISNRK